MTMLIYNAAFFFLFLLLLSLLSVQLSDASVESPLHSTALAWADNEGESFVANNAILDPLLAETWDAGSAEFPTFADIAYPEDVYAYLAGPFTAFVLNRRPIAYWSGGQWVQGLEGVSNGNLLLGPPHIRQWRTTNESCVPQFASVERDSFANPFLTNLKLTPVQCFNKLQTFGLGFQIKTSSTLDTRPFGPSDEWTLNTSLPDLIFPVSPRTAIHYTTDSHALLLSNNASQDASTLASLQSGKFIDAATAGALVYVQQQQQQQCSSLLIIFPFPSLYPL